MSEHHSAARASEAIKASNVCECVPARPEAGPSVVFPVSLCLLVGSRREGLSD